MQTVETTDQQPASPSEQAIGVLRATSDGDLLAPADLSLLQFVVNRGRDALSVSGAARWDYLVSSTEQGTYVRPWFHGVENLYKQCDGYVLWRGEIVEHFSYRDAQEELAGAQHLGACCRLIEHRGLRVSASALNAIWTELDLGANQGLERWQVMWSLSALEKGAAICKLTGESVPEILSSRAANTEREAVRLQCDSRDIRSMVVVTAEDCQSVLQAIVGDRQWESQARPLKFASGRLDMYDELQKQVARAIDAATLPTRAQVRQRILEPVFSTLSDGRDASNLVAGGKSDESDGAARQERQRG